MRTFHRGAAVAMTFKGARIEFDRDLRRRREYYQHVFGTAVTADDYRVFGNTARQRKKGPITRFGQPR